MGGLPRTGTPLPCTALTNAQARSIAEAFRPVRVWGNRSDYFYTRSKLGSDPLYGGVVSTMLHMQILPRWIHHVFIQVLVTANIHLSLKTVKMTLTLMMMHKC